MTPGCHLSGLFAYLAKEVIPVLQCLGLFWTENFSMPALASQFHHNKNEEEKGRTQPRKFSLHSHYLILRSFVGVFGAGILNFSCPAFILTCASIPDSWNILELISTPLLANSGMFIPRCVTNSIATEGLAMSSACIYLIKTKWYIYLPNTLLTGFIKQV